jgi:gamma-glutamylcysteine synthetase
MTNDQEIIKELREQLEIEITVKKNEVLLNKELKEHIEKLNLHIETLNLINDKYANIIASLRLRLKELIIKL